MAPCILPPPPLAPAPWSGGILQPLSSLTRPASCRPLWISATLPLRPPPSPYRTHHISFIRFICHICHIRFIRHIRLIHHINNIHTKWWRPPPCPCGSALRPRGTHALPSPAPLHMHHLLRPCGTHRLHTCINSDSRRKPFGCRLVIVASPGIEPGSPP